MNKQAKGGGVVIVIILLILVILGIWGYVGGQEAQKVGVTCDMGLGDTFCWKWHTNVAGAIEEGIGDLFGG